MKDNAVKQDKDRNDEMIVSALRAIVSLTRMPGIDNCNEFQDFMKNTVLSGDVAAKYNAVLDAEKGTDDIAQ
jgi:cullin-associated NEDD8-dissociated protein 1